MNSVFNPLSVLVLLIVVSTTDDAISAYHGQYASRESGLVFAFSFQLLFAWWVYFDRRKHLISLPFEFEAFVFFAWPIVMPYYLFATRGWWAIPILMAWAMVFFIPDLVDVLVTFWR